MCCTYEYHPACMLIQKISLKTSRLQTFQLFPCFFLSLFVTVTSDCPVAPLLSPAAFRLPFSLASSSALGVPYLARGGGKERQNEKPVGLHAIRKIKEHERLRTVTRVWTRAPVKHCAFNRNSPKPLILV